MKILVVTNNYPSKAFPNHGAFVYNLMQELAKDNQITIIAPEKAHRRFKRRGETYGKEACRIYRPLFWSMGNKKRLGIRWGEITARSYIKAVNRTLNSLTEKPDVVYVHFLSNAIPVLRYVEENKIPLVIASGESTYKSWLEKADHIQSKVKLLADHIICVSNENRNQLLSMGFNSEKISVIPNAVDYETFKPLDKMLCKEKIGISQEKFTVGFVGHFIDRKGPNRIIEAIKMLNDKNIQLVCVGGVKEDLIHNDFTRVIGPVPNFQLPEILNAFDIFVLPTLHEGHCNVIEEAKATCLPIISSLGTSVEEQIDDSIGILVDPLNVEEVSRAIAKFRDNRLLYSDAVEELVKRRGDNSLSDRTNKIRKLLTQVYPKIR